MNDTTPLCILLQGIAGSRRTANCVQYTEYDVKLNVTHDQITVRIAEIVLSFQTLLSTFSGFVREGTTLERLARDPCIQEATSPERLATDPCIPEATSPETLAKENRINVSYTPLTLTTILRV